MDRNKEEVNMKNLEVYRHGDVEFEIWKTKNGYEILNCNGQFLRKCKTKKECKERIDTQTV